MYGRCLLLNGKFLVLERKTILISLLMISLLTMFCVFGSNLVEKTIETVTDEKLLPIYSVETNEKKVAITFDCAWGADDIESIVNTLEFNNVSATFFTVGTWVDKFSEAVKLLFDAGMEIGNHSNSHKHVNKMSYGENLEDMTNCNSKIGEITGTQVKFYRGPYGEYNNTVISVAKELNMKVIQWDVDTLDYTRKND